MGWFLVPWCPPPAFRSCFVEVAQHSNDLLMNLWGKKWSPHPIPLPFKTVPPELFLLEGKRLKWNIFILVLFFFLLLILFIFFIIFYFAILYWFCHTSTWIYHWCTRIPNPETPSHLPPHTIPLGHPIAPAPSILYPASNLDWRFVSYLIVYMFQCHSPKSSHSFPLPQSPKDCSIYLCLFCCLTFRVIITIFLNSIHTC